MSNLDTQIAAAERHAKRLSDGEKPCSRCKVVKKLGEFGKSAGEPLGLSFACRACLRAEAKVNSAIKRSAEKGLTPSWTSYKDLLEVAVQCPPDYHMDHIWPTKHGGLNCPQNLCFLPAKINNKKRDKLPTDPEIVALMKAHAIYPILGAK